jgi:putative oxidoreductase
MPSVGLLALRLALAVVFVAHGLHKLAGVFTGPGVGPGGIEATAATYAAMGLRPAFVLAVVGGLVQLIGGFCIGVGFFARWAAVAVAAYVVIGIWVEHRHWGLFLNWVVEPGRGHGTEYSLVLTAALLCLMLVGAGDFSVDGLRAKTAASRAAGRARLRRQ